MPVNIGRPELIAALGGVATWPLASRAQRSDAVRRIGVLMTVSADDPDQQNGARVGSATAWHSNSKHLRNAAS
jgi:hypothetical protein